MDAVEHRLLILARRRQVADIAEHPDAAGGAAPASGADMRERDAVEEARLQHAQAPLRPDRPVGKGQADRTDPALPPAADAAGKQDAGQRPGQENHRIPPGGPQQAGRCSPAVPTCAGARVSARHAGSDGEGQDLSLALGGKPSRASVGTSTAPDKQEVPHPRVEGLQPRASSGSRALAVEIDDGIMDGVVERGGVGEGLVGEVMGLKIAPDRLDVVEFQRVFWQPLDGEPVCAGGQGGQRAFAGVDRTIVLDQHDRRGLSPGLRCIETVELLQMGDEIAAALGRARMDDELARDVIERPQHRDLLGLPRRRHAQVRPRLRPGAGEIGMGQRLALDAVEKNDVARFGLSPVQAQAPPFHLAFRLTSLQRVPGPSPAELFFRKALDSCERLMRTPSRASIAARRRGIVHRFFQQGGGHAQGGFSFIGGGPGAMLAFSATTPPAVKSLRQRRTVSSRTPNASAILGLVQPASVSSTARARPASPRSREPARATRAARCSSLAVTGDFPAMPHTLQIGPGNKSETYPLVNQTESA